MKKVLFLFVVLIFAENSFSQGFQFGLKSGADLKQVSGKAFSEKFTFGYHIGAFAQIPLSKKLSLQPELYYSETSHDTATGFTTILNLKPVSQIKLGYINVPILLNFKPTNSMAIQAGVKYGLLAQNNVTILANAKEAIRNGDLSAVLGAQLYVASLRVYARYQIGLTNINDIGNRDKWTNQSIHVGVGLRLL